MAAGFLDFVINWRAHVFRGTPQASSAASFGALGITFRAHKPRDEQEWLAAVNAAQTCAIAPVQTLS